MGAHGPLGEILQKCLWDSTKEQNKEPIKSEDGNTLKYTYYYPINKMNFIILALYIKWFLFKVKFKVECHYNIICF